MKRIVSMTLVILFVATLCIAAVVPRQMYDDSGVFGLTYKGTATQMAAIPSSNWVVAEGDVWYDTTENIMKVYTGAVWAPQGARSITKTFSLADMTDGGTTAATYTFTETIPLGAVVTRTLVSNITGFIGDTSAVIIIGDGTDTDRYNTGTPSVFTTIAALDVGAISGTVYHAALKAPVVTITAATEWGDVTAGTLTVTIFYYFSG